MAGLPYATVQGGRRFAERDRNLQITGPVWAAYAEFWKKAMDDYGSEFE